MSISLLKKVIEKFPEARILSNGAVADLLAKDGIEVSIQGIDFITMETGMHEKVLSVAPHNSVFHIFEQLTHPGDSLSFEKSEEVLALPIQAPWGSTVQALEKAVSLKPRLVIPIHDWHWKDEARHAMYQMASSYFLRHDIEFRGLEQGESIDIIHS